MPGGYEAALRLVEHHLGRASTAKQTRGIFPSLSGAPEVNVGRVIRDRAAAVTGTASQDQSTITAHGVRPTFRLPIEAKPEDLLIPMMAFFHNRKYTEITPVAGNIEVGRFQFGMLDAKPDHVGVVVGDYDDAAGSFQEVVSMADAYTFGIEWLYGHGDLGDTDNASFIENAVVNRLGFEVSRGVDQYLIVTAEGFGRTGDEAQDIVEANWGPGTNGEISQQAVLTPGDASFNVFELNAVDLSGVYTDWIDRLSLEITTGMGGRDSLGHDEFRAFQTEGRPSLSGSIELAHVGGDFFNALKNAHKFDLDLTFATGVANEHLRLKLNNLRFVEGFQPQGPGDVNTDSRLVVPFKGVVDATVAEPMVEVEIETRWDVRTNSFATNASLASIP